MPGMQVNSLSRDVPTCDLCGLRCPPRPPAATWKDKSYQFCCSGCLQVFTILSESGLFEGDYKNSDIYQTSLRLGIIGQGEALEKQSEDPRPDAAVDSAMEKKELTLHIQGMWCSACSWLIDKVMSAERGIAQSHVIFAADTARIVYYPQLISPEKIKLSINKLGYKALEREEARSEAGKERNRLLLRMGMAVVLALNIMMFNSVLYVGYFQDVAENMSHLILYLLWVLSTPSVFWAGWSIHYKGWKSLRAGAPTMELLLSLGILVSYFYSIYVLFSGHTHVYFDTSASLVALVLLGKFFEWSARHKATRGVRHLYELLPQKVRLKTESGERLVAIEHLAVSDPFIVKPGEKIPADGEVLTGESSVDESLLTGESTPILKSPGATVIGSSINISGTITVRTMRIGTDTAIARIIQLMESALLAKSPIERLVDRVSRWFIPTVLTLAAATFLMGYTLGQGLETALMRGLTVLIIACPCALGIATPLAVIAGIGYAAGRGILIRDAAVFSRASKLTDLFFDKTGTITRGRFQVLAHQCENHAHRLADLQLVAAVEKTSSHPIAAALVLAAREENIILPECAQVTFMEGMGAVGRLQGDAVTIGNRALFEKSAIPLSEAMHEASREQEECGHTVIFYHIHSRGASGLFVLGDRIHPQALELTSRLVQQKIAIHLISGDSQATTKAVAQRAGFHRYSAEMTPQQKIEKIREVQRAGKMVGMVGDGVNDAPGLAQADIGIAVGSGTEFAMASADVILMQDNLLAVFESLDIAKRTRRTIQQNLTWAFFYNTIGIVVAISGYLNPLIAAVAMLISSMSVVANSLRLHAGPGHTSQKLREIVLPWIDR
jgi:heavy metal translocating P-type ATPase